LIKRRQVLQRDQDFRLAHAVTWLLEPWRNQETHPDPLRAEDVFPWLADAHAEQRAPTDQDTIKHRLMCLSALMSRGAKE